MPNMFNILLINVANKNYESTTKSLENVLDNVSDVLHTE
jgi:hypothetical protein